ncbi:kinase-like domain-containing protein [Astrocystis sublimbata]|nr:kinase-like domain-containing protein [Astrocystis sublimbata]
MRKMSNSPPPPSPPPPPTRTKVLFNIPADQFLTPLPLVDEIESSLDIIKTLFGRRVVRVREKFVVKYGPDVQPIDGENMVFARQHLESLTPRVIVPRLLAIYQKYGPMSQTVTYIVAEYCPGHQLDTIWDKMPKSERLDAVGLLHDAVKLIRSIPAPDYFGSLGKTKINDEYFGPEDSRVATSGPFSTEEELIQAIMLRYREVGGRRLANRANYFGHMLPQLLKGNGKSIFTHGDLQRKNILVGPGGEIVIVDWALSGWYPIWWEYAISTICCGLWKDDWYSYIPKILSQEFPNQYLWLDTLRTELWS